MQHPTEKAIPDGVAFFSCQFETTFYEGGDRSFGLRP